MWVKFVVIVENGWNSKAMKVKVLLVLWCNLEVLLLKIVTFIFL